MASARTYDGLIPLPPHLWHLTTLSPFLRVPFPSQFLQGFFFSPSLFRMVSLRIQSLEYTFAHLHNQPLEPRISENFRGEADAKF
jgi:hypothetical protein